MSFLLFKLKLRVVNNRGENLLNFEAWPQDGKKDGYNRQVKGIARVQAPLQEIIDLANTDQPLLMSFITRKIWPTSSVFRLFPTFIGDKLARVEEKYRDILVKLEDWKQVFQSRELICGPTSLQVAGQAKEPTKPEPPPPLPSGHINFPKQKRLLKFRIFEVLKAQRLYCWLV